MLLVIDIVNGFMSSQTFCLRSSYSSGYV